MFGTFTNPKYGHTKVSQLVSDGIIKVSKKYSPKDSIQYIDISSIEKSSKSIASTTKYRVDEAPSRAQQCVQYGDIILSNVRPNLKTIAIVKSSEDNLVCSSGFTVLRCKESEPEYLVVAILDDYYTDKLMKKANGSNYPAVTSKDVLDGWIPSAPIELQHSFSSFVKQVNKSKSICKQIFQSLDNLVKSRFIEMFGNPIANRFCWPIGKMRAVAPAVQFSQEPMQEGNWLLNLDAIQSNSGEILFKNKVSKDELTGSVMSFGTGNVLYSKLRPYLNKVVVPNEPGYGTTELIPLLPNPELLNQTYFACLLRSDPFVNKFSSAVAGTKMPRVSMDTFWKFDVPLPPIDLQNEFATFVKQVDKSKVAISVL